MLYADNQHVTDPRINLAIEEFLLRYVESDAPILLFYINEPSIIIGRNQNALEEIDPDFVEQQGIHVVRRLSGGGAVFHDLGNLNFSFITAGREDLHNFAKFTEPVVRVLRTLGVPAELHGSSDIFADGKKISGNAQYSTPKRMFSHGTLLFDTDLETMLRALNPRQVQIESKAVQSIRSYVANIRELLPEGMSIERFKMALLEEIFGTAVAPQYVLDATDWEKIRQIMASRYQTWEWNIGRAPKFNVQKSEAFPVGKIDARIDVQNGRIAALKLYGTFFSQRPVSELESQLIGVRYSREAIEAALAQVDLVLYLGNLSTAEFAEFLY